MRGWKIWRGEAVSGGNRMNAPLPEVPPYAPKKRDFAKVPLPSLSVLCVVQALINVLYLVFHTPLPDLPPFWSWILYGVFTALSLLLLGYLYRGYSLARRIYLGIIVLTLWVYFFPDETLPTSPAERIVSHFDLANSLFLLVYLNLPNVKAHFAGRKTVE